MKLLKNLKFIVVLAMLALGLSAAFAQSSTLVVWADGERAPLLQELAPQVQAELGIELEVVELGLGDARDQLLVAGPVGEGPDVLIQPHDTIGQLVANGALVPLELGEDLLAEFEDSALNLFTYQDQLWGVPYAVENIALIRNTDLVPDAPQTWQEIRELAEQFQEDGTAEYAFVVQTGNTYHNYPITSAFGGYIFGRNEDGTFDVSDIGLSSEGGFAAAEWLSGMYNDGLMPPDVNDDVAFQLFEEGEAAMFVTGPWFSQRIREAGVPYSIDPLPYAEGITEVGQPFSGGQGFVISAFSENQLLAEIFLTDFVATLDFQQVIFDQGGRPPAFRAVDTSTDENIPAFVAAGQNAVPMPAVPQMSAVWGSSDNALTLISTGSDPVAAFTTATEQILEAIDLQASEERIIGVPGSYQAETACEAPWQPACEATFMELQEDGTYTLTVDLPAGEYEFKIAINGTWDENYGVDGERDGPNYPLVLEEDSTVTFTYNDETNVAEVTVE